MQADFPSPRRGEIAGDRNPALGKSSQSWLYPFLILNGFFLYFLFRGMGVEPIVFADEWLHSTGARLVRFADAYSPSFGFYAIYRATNSCGQAFLECARILNILLFLGSSLVFYRFSRRYLDTPYALILLLVYLALPSNIYLLLFTPDAMFYALFVLFFISVVYREGVSGALVAGSLLGVMAVVKTNAMFLVAGLIFFFLLETWFERKSWRRFLALSAIGVLAFLASRTILAVALAGPKGLSFTGKHYTSHAAHGVDPAWLLEKLPLLLFSAYGQLLTVAIVLGTFVGCLFIPSNLAPVTPSERRLALAVIGLFVPVIGAMTIFWVLASEIDSISITRLSLRYYSFFFPFAYLYILVRLTRLRDDDAWTTRQKLPIFLVLVASGASLVLIPKFFTPLSNESPELWLLVSNWLGTIAVWLACIVPLAVLLVRPSLAARTYAGLLLLSCAAWAVASAQELKPMKTPAPSDAAGRHAALFLGEHRRHVAIVSSDVSTLYRAAFHLNAVGPEMIHIDGRLNEEAWKRIEAKAFTLLIGPEALRLAPAKTFAPKGFALVPTELLVRP